MPGTAGPIGEKHSKDISSVNNALQASMRPGSQGRISNNASPNRNRKLRETK